MTPRARAAAALLLLLPTGGSAAATQEPAGPPARFALSALPAGGAEQGWFVLRARPGDVLRRVVRVSNLAHRPTTVLLSAADAGTGPQGGVTYGEADAPARADGRWVTPEVRRVVLPARGARDVAVRIAVPAGARPGTHLAGLVARAEQPEVHSEPLAGGSSAVLQVHLRQVLAVEVRLPGDARPAVVPTGLHHEDRLTGPVLVLAAENTGTGLGPARGSVRLSGPVSLALPVVLGTTVPRTAFSGPLPLPRPLEPGRYTARVELRDPTGSVQRLQTSFEVTAAAPAAPPQRAVAPLPLGGPAGVGPAPVRAGEAAVPPALTAAALLAALLVGGLALLAGAREQRSLARRLQER